MVFDPQRISPFAVDLARQAGALILQARAAGLTRDFKGGQELVTDADVAADRLITDAIRARFPHHRIISEELAPTQGIVDIDGPAWIIDPIDGTVNYAHGHRQSAVCIAYAEAGAVHCGVVYNPFTDELFRAAIGQGAWLNDQRIQVTAETNPRRALIATGFPYDKSELAPLVRRVAAILTHCADLRRLGSAALDICWVACGRLDGYYESLSLWDFAAARLIAAEAGARCGHFLPPPVGVNPVFHEKHLLIANPGLYPQLQEILRAAEAD